METAMVRIERRGNGFSMFFNDPGSGMRGFRAQARNVREVNLALLHFYEGHPTAAFSARAREGDSCPLCGRRAEQQEYLDRTLTVGEVTDPAQVKNPELRKRVRRILRKFP